jgi:hypothetical protein
VTLPRLWAELSREAAQRSPTRKKAVACGGEAGKSTEESDEKESRCVWRGGRQERNQHVVVWKKAKRGRAISLSHELKLGQRKLEMYFGLKERICKMVSLSLS